MSTRTDPYRCSVGNVWWSNGPKGERVDFTIEYNGEVIRFYSLPYEADKDGNARALVYSLKWGQYIEAYFRLSQVCAGPMPSTLIVSGGF